jgi:hypothetical protein
MMAKDALGAHVRNELGISETTVACPGASRIVERGALRVVRLDRLLDLIDRQASDVAAVCAAPAASCARATAS